MWAEYKQENMILQVNNTHYEENFFDTGLSQSK